MVSVKQVKHIFAVGFLTFLMNDGFAKELYRYTDDKGHVVINNRMPAQYVVNGYDVLDGQGRFIKKIPRQATKAELVQQKAESVLMQEQEDLKNKDAHYDLSLLKKFSFVSDIKAEQRRKSDELYVRVSILKGNLKSLRAEVDAEYDKAANLERSSSRVSPLITDRIQQLEKQTISTEALLVKHEQDIARLNEEYERAIRRFQELIAIKSQYKTQNTQ